tara:strand:- start:659 stop:1222 length:564 start_codon:yes stop_codon:yes gene_type:complete
VRPGDVLAFSNRGPAGWVINLTTWGVPTWGYSHLALVGLHPITGRIVLWESIMTYDMPCLLQEKLVKGMQVQDIDERIERYNGRIWHYALRKPLSSAERTKLTEYGQRYLGTNYDYVGAFRSRGLSCIEKCIFRPEDLTAIYCSEWCIAAHRYVERIVGVNASRMNPNRAMRVERKMNVVQPRTRVK